MPGNTPGATLGVVDSIDLSGADEFLAVLHVYFDVTSSGDTTIVSALTNKIRVLSLVFTVSANVSVAWFSGTSGEGQTARIPAMSWNQNGGMCENFLPGWFMETAAARSLVMNLSTNANVRGSLNYVEIA